MDQIDYFFERVKGGKYMREVEITNAQGEKVARRKDEVHMCYKS